MNSADLRRWMLVLAILAALAAVEQVIRESRCDCGRVCPCKTKEPHR